MEKIERKHMLYKSKVEYMAGEGIYAMNHVQGCSHGCKYPCYAYLAAKRNRQVEGYEEWCRPKLVGNALELLERELDAKRKEPIKRVHMCFTTDPLPYAGADFDTRVRIGKMSSDAVVMINDRGIPVTLLTKGVFPNPIFWGRKTTESRPHRPDGWPPLPPAYFGSESEEASTRLHPGNEYGISLASLDERFRERWEPGAAPYAERIESLRKLHDAGCKTWVSMEPFPDPAVQMESGEGGAGCPAPIRDAHSWLPLFRSLEEMLEEVAFVDKIVFGRWNYRNSDDRYDDFYGACASIVRGFCTGRGIECVIKEGTES